MYNWIMYNYHAQLKHIKIMCKHYNKPKICDLNNITHHKNELAQGHHLLSIQVLHEIEIVFFLLV